MSVSDLEIDVTRLQSYLSEELGTAVVDTDILQNGVNLTLALSTDRQSNAYILQRPNSLRETDYFVELGREYAVMQRLRETDVPAPAPVFFCDDESVTGGPFSVVEYLDGAAVPWGSPLPDRYQSVRARKAVSERLIEVLARIHTVDSETFEDGCEQYTPAERVERAIDRLAWATEVTGRELPVLWDVADWLRANAPVGTTTALVHGDYKPDNVLLTGDGPRVAGVIDWEAATLGDPLVDLGFLLLFWRDSDDPAPAVTPLADAYPDNDAIDRLRLTNENGFWPFTKKQGCFTRRELVARYQQHTDIAFENQRFYRALAPFTIATVWETFHRRWREGGRDSHWEPLVEYMALLADSIVNGEFEL